MNPTRKSRLVFRQTKAELLEGHRTAKDEVSDIVAEVRDFTGRPCSPPSHRHVKPDRMLRSQVRVADLEGEVARMRAEVEQFLERRISGCACQADGECESFLGRSRRKQQTDGTRPAREAAGFLTERLVIRVIEASPNWSVTFGHVISSYRNAAKPRWSTSGESASSPLAPNARSRYEPQSFPLVARARGVMPSTPLLRCCW
jgi:hypothetical protein